MDLCPPMIISIAIGIKLSYYVIPVSKNKMVMIKTTFAWKFLILKLKKLWAKVVYYATCKTSYRILERKWYET